MVSFISCEDIEVNKKARLGNGHYSFSYGKVVKIKKIFFYIGCTPLSVNPPIWQ